MATSPSGADVIEFNIYLPDGRRKAIGCEGNLRIKALLRRVLSKTFLSSNFAMAYKYFAIQARYSNEEKYCWLSPNTTINAIFEDLNKQKDVKYYLRIRFHPDDLLELSTSDNSVFLLYYEQVRNDYLNEYSSKISTENAIKLAVLQMRCLFKHLTQSALEKKGNFELIEKDYGLHKFLPQRIIDSFKSKKVLRKSIQQEFKNYVDVTPAECALKFCHSVLTVHPYDMESFKCTLQAGLSINVSVCIGIHVGIGYATDNLNSTSLLTKFENIRTIQAKTTSEGSGLLILKLKTSAKAIVIGTANVEIASDMADLTEGYCCFYKKIKDGSVSSVDALEEGSKGGGLSNRSTLVYSDEEDEDEDDYETIENLNQRPGNQGESFAIDPERIKFDRIIGEGQFGDVFCGTFQSKDSQNLEVAVKTCKDTGTTKDKFLDEAYSMTRFNHSNIVRLIGIHTGQPVFIVMELAKYGEPNRPELKELNLGNAAETSSSPPKNADSTVNVQAAASNYEDVKWLQSKLSEPKSEESIQQDNTEKQERSETSSEISVNQQSSIATPSAPDNIRDACIAITTELVQSVVKLNKQSKLATMEECGLLIKAVGSATKNLLDKVEEVEMSSEIVSTDAIGLVTNFKLAQKSVSTNLYDEYIKLMLQSAHVLAINARQLLSVINEV
ncbi:Focal adhesion kinase 1 [Trichoplax sp. H2]|nr:Focal adhesion kinase 1 [Trichoplax sp. H2]|eukprot:RDD43285.1 Focal adhesion kinase 1 [Trichoplax sp. H2]